MTKRDLTAIGLRLMGILAFLYAGQLLESGVLAATAHLRRYHVIDSLPDAIAQNGAMGFCVALGPCVFCCGLASMLWWRATTLAAWLWRGSHAEEIVVRGVAASDALTLLMVVGGVYTLAVGVSLLLTWVGSCLWASGSANGLDFFEWEVLFVQFLNVAIHAGVGSLLMAKARPIAVRAMQRELV